MSATLMIEMAEWHKAARAWAIESSRELSAAINSRMFYLMLRAYILLPPQSPDAKRLEIRKYMTQAPRAESGVRGFITKKGKGKFKRHGKSRQLQVRHLLAQKRSVEETGHGIGLGYSALARNKLMKRAATSVARRAIGSIGYLKSAVVRAIKKLNGHFTQFGREPNKKGENGVSANRALVTMADSYGLSAAIGNVGTHKGSKAYVTMATPGINPISTTQLSLGIADDQTARVNERYQTAFAKAYRDERRDMERHLAITGQAVANKYSVIKT